MTKTIASAKVKIAQRLADELEDGQVVNLGVGIPTMVPDYIGDKQVFLQSENGLLGMGSTPPDEDVDMDLISASKKPITMAKGASIFDSAASFSMIRGGHIHVAVLGVLQVDQTGEIANWAVPGQTILGVGGSMDLVAGAKKIIIGITHQAKDGSAKIVKELTYPSSGARKISVIITEKAVFKIANGGLLLTEIDPELTVEQLREITEAHFEVSPNLSKDYV